MSERTIAQVDSDSAIHKFETSIRLCLEEYYCKTVSENIKKRMLTRIESGYSVSRPPFGYSRAETRGLYKLNKFGRSLSEILEKILEEELSIEDGLTAISFLYSLGTDKRLKSYEVIRLLKNPYYRGDLSWNGHLYSGKHAPLLANGQYDKLLQIIGKEDS